MTQLLFAVPWLLLAVMAPLAFRRKPRIRDFLPKDPDQPLVSIIIPARNEADNIAPCVATLLDSAYNQREIIVVDDGSTDGTGEIARALAEHAASEARVVRTAPLPAGWIGKSWACWTGYQHAHGELLLFTDADTRHDQDVLTHAVAAQRSSGAALVSLMPRQLMLSFWERVVLPHIFVPIQMRFGNLSHVNRQTNPRGVIANGQFMLFDRAAYERIGGHASSPGEIVEDLVIAQKLVAAGERILIAYAGDLIETRMYRSLREIVEGWTKNLDRGARATFPPGFGRLAVWAGAAAQLLLWVVPPVVLLAGLLVGYLAPVREWAIAATALGAVFWLTVHALLRTSLVHSLFFPLGAAVSSYILVRSGSRGHRVEWRGRWYELTQN